MLLSNQRVVANEVKKLAEQSSSSAADISSLIREVQSSTSRAVQAMNKGVLDVEKGSELIDAAGQVFNLVTDKVFLKGRRSSTRPWKRYLPQQKI